MHDPAALLITSDASLLKAVQPVLAGIPQLRVLVATRPDEAVGLMECPGVVLLVAHLRDEDDEAELTALLRSLETSGKSAATLIVVEQYRAEQALAFLRQGAADYLSRPLDLGRLAYLADVLTIRARLAPPRPAPALHRLAVATLGESEPFLYLPSEPLGVLMEQIRRVAPQDTTLLLTGETGTGKTRLARLIHEMSPRRHEPFQVVHCGALSSNLIASELFGHVRGAYTGADRDRAGKLAEVGRGTLFLDEIDTLPVEVQAKLLRVVEERVFERVGADRPLAMQARLIVATNRDLEQEVAARQFRSDLYYRLNVVGFHLPPLRERRELIPHLARHFVAGFAARNRRPVTGIAEEALAGLQNSDWPGNARELRNVIERAVALCPGSTIQLDDLPLSVRAAAPRSQPAAAVVRTDGPVTLARTKEEAEIRRITEALERHRNNRLRAAAELGISRMALYKKLHRYGLMGAT